MGAYAFRLDGERTGPLWTLPLQQFVYRQLMYLVVIQSVVTAVAGTRLRWQRMERYGSLQMPAPTPRTAPAAPPDTADLGDSWLREARGGSAASDHHYLRGGETPEFLDGTTPAPWYDGTGR